MKTSTIARNTELAALAEIAPGAILLIYDGPAPVTPEAAVGKGNRLLAELRLGSPAFSTPSNGRMTAHPIAPDPDAKETGTARWYRMVKADGTTPLWDATIGPDGSGADLTMNSVDIRKHAHVSITSLVYSLPT